VNRKVIGWTFESVVSERFGTVYIVDNVVTAIQIVTEGSIDVSSAFEALGQPEGTVAVEGLGGDSKWALVAFLYPHDGLVLTEYRERIPASSSTLTVSPDDPVRDVFFVRTDEYYDLVYQLNFTGMGTTEDSVRSGVVTWTGYGGVPLLKPD